MDRHQVNWDSPLEPKHKIFLSHSGAQKSFVEALCDQLEDVRRFPFFDKRADSLPLGERFPDLIFQAAQQCRVAVVILSEEYFTTKWPMLELVAFMQARESDINKPKILPLFFKTSLSELGDTTRRNHWFSAWEVLAQADHRVKLGKWKDALKQLPSFKGIEYVKRGESPYQEDSVKAYRDVVRILGKFEKTCESLRNGVRVVGLYGTGGIGKTTFCKVLCNELDKKFHGKVCHAELGNPTLELLKVVIKTLTDTAKQQFEHWTEDQCRNYLKHEVRRRATFLALDNVSIESLDQAKMYLDADFHKDSMVLVTARSLSILTSHLKINESHCMEMPELEREEATKLFLNHAAPDYDSFGDKDHDNDIQRCVEECLYSKGENFGSHYHPLALKVLGEQLRSSDPSEWQDVLDEEPDKFNLLGETTHRVFSVLKRSYNSLREDDQLFFMDVALYTPEKYIFLEVPGNIFYWLSMVHNLEVTQVRRRLERLKTRGMLEDLGDGFRSIAMHELFRELAKMEVKAVDFDTRRCVYETDDITELQRKRSGNCCSKLVRIALTDCFDLESFAGIKWHYFSNLVVLKLFRCDLDDDDLNLEGLELLRSLDAYDCSRLSKLPGLQALKYLTYLRLTDVPIRNKTLDHLPVSLKHLHLQGHMELYRPPNLDHCTNLRELTLQLCPEMFMFPDLSKLSSLRKIFFSGCYKAHTVRGLNSQLSKLESLRVVGNASRSVSCPGLGELIGLQELQLRQIDSMEPADLQKLTNLKVLEILSNKLTRLSGLERLTNLEALSLKGCIVLRSLENLRQLPALRLLNVGGCCNLRSLKVYDCASLTMCLGLSDLAALEELYLCNVGVKEVPYMKELYLRNVGLLSTVEPQGEPNFAKLKILNLHGCTELKSLEDIGPLPALQQLDVSCCSKLEELPDLGSSSKLELLNFSQSAVQLRYRDVYRLASMPLLSPVTIVKEDSVDSR
ncbi:disease resistance protein Roq1 isoform X2 [Physcomitrium patens]|uniref:TIR domain-containing protein n=1 Tax=Physcomitrium patens TaxID=3218 RepID=A0A7I4CRM8_PHYPA